MKCHSSHFQMQIQLAKKRRNRFVYASLIFMYKCVTYQSLPNLFAGFLSPFGETEHPVQSVWESGGLCHHAYLQEQVSVLQAQKVPWSRHVTWLWVEYKFTLQILLRALRKFVPSVTCSSKSSFPKFYRRKQAMYCPISISNVRKMSNSQHIWLEIKSKLWAKIFLFSKN